jgi:hypothetical protein
MPSIERPVRPAATSHEGRARVPSAFTKLLACGSMPLVAPFVTALAVADRDAGFVALHRWASWFLDCFGIEVQVDDANGADSHPGTVFVLLNQTSLLDGLSGVRALPGPFASSSMSSSCCCPGSG